MLLQQRLGERPELAMLPANQHECVMINRQIELLPQIVDAQLADVRVDRQTKGDGRRLDGRQWADVIILRYRSRPFAPPEFGAKIAAGRPNARRITAGSASARFSP